MSVGAPTTIADNEQLARFIVSARWVRADNTVKQDAFLPFPYLNLSVTQHASLSNSEIWDCGRRVAKQRERPLQGRADVQARVARGVGLSVVSHPLEEDPEHAHISGWPSDKPAQKSLAQQIAAAAHFKKHDAEVR